MRKTALLGALRRYGAAALFIILAAATRWAVQPIMGAAPPYITFYLAIVAAAAYGGLRPGLFATALGGLIGIGVATSPIEAIQLGTAAEQLRLAIYILSGCAISLIADSLHKAKRRALEQAAQLQRVSDELRFANRRLAEGDRAKDKFMAMLAHELRNPLMPIKNGLFILERAPEGGAGQRARNVINRQVEHLAKLVNDLLDVTRVTHNKLRLEQTAIDLRQVVRHTVEDHRPLFVQKDVRLYERCSALPVWVHADAARMAQVVGNLLTNAVKFTDAGGEVHVELARAAPLAVLRVWDTGAGMDPETLPKIFRAFVQGDEGRGGLGLGLTLVKHVVELHGGSVKASSQGAGSGAEFVVTLPLDVKAR